MSHDERKQEGLKIPTWALGIIIFIISSSSAALMAWGQARADIQSLKDTMQKSEMSATLVAQHEAVIPILQQDLKDVKSDVGEIRRDIKEILKAVKA